MIIKLDNLKPDYLNAPLLAGDSLEIEPGGKVLLLGNSGTGKTTLISILYGLRKDYSGNICIGEMELNKLKPDNWAELRQTALSIVFQDLKLFEHLTGYENILIKAKLSNKIPEEKAAGFKKADNTYINKLAKALNIKNIINKKISAMSFGEKQRISIARALVQPFSWLFLDEPFSHLDSTNKRAAIKLITEVCENQNAGIILAEHDDDSSFNFSMKIRL